MRFLQGVLSFIAAVVGIVTQHSPAAAKPNLVVIMTDDQDDTGSMSYMPKVDSLLARHGITFTNSFADFPLCCPSRASFLSGLSAHNHNITSNRPPDGGYDKFSANGDGALGVWLQNAGYATAFMGKPPNGYGFHDPILPGWTEWYGLLSNNYFNYVINENGTKVEYGSRVKDYVTDVLAAKAVDFIARRRSHPEPFFLVVAPSAIHDESKDKPYPISAPRHKGRYAGLPLAKRANFNERNVTDKPHLIADLPLLNSGDIANDKKRYQKRLESLLAVDDLVEDIVQALNAIGALNNTIIVYTSDNGLSFGSHRWSGKRIIYEETSRVPLIIRWPGMPANQTRSHLVTNLDLVATIVDEARAAPSNILDGHTLKPIAADPNANWRTAVLLHGAGYEDYDTYHMSAVRTHDYIYTRHKSTAYGIEEEFYDLVYDPYQQRNDIDSEKYAPVIDFLRSLMPGLSTCSGAKCWVTTVPPT